MLNGDCKCRKNGQAKPKPSIEEVLDEERQQIDEVELFYDLMALALQTDSTRVATFETGLGFRTSELTSIVTMDFLIMGNQRPDWSASGGGSFFNNEASNFLERLKESQIFDDTLVVFGSGMSDGSIHSNRNLPVLLAVVGSSIRGMLFVPKSNIDESPFRICGCLFCSGSSRRSRSFW